jgi:FAD/FMN-containing dehydrogenase
VLTADAGVLLSEILTLVMPHGYFLEVTPGTAQVTLGGAIANDVHGKNHHRRGTFGRSVVASRFSQ